MPEFPSPDPDDDHPFVYDIENDYRSCMVCKRSIKPECTCNDCQTARAVGPTYGPTFGQAFHNHCAYELLFATPPEVLDGLRSEIGTKYEDVDEGGYWQEVGSVDREAGMRACAGKGGEDGWHYAHPPKNAIGRSQQNNKV